MSKVDVDIKIIMADYLDKRQATDIGHLLSCYAADPMGGGEPINKKIQHNLAHELSKIAQAFSILCYADRRAAGLINCFQGFSTFKCKPLINIHDIYVATEYRGFNISQLMLDKVEEIARQRNCCKLTLEVLEGNRIAQQAYKKFGFRAYELDPEIGKALFWQKDL